MPFLFLKFQRVAREDSGGHMVFPLVEGVALEKFFERRGRSVYSEGGSSWSEVFLGVDRMAQGLGWPGGSGRRESRL
jgi:hypothetical protein